eukprot:15419900-Alexandrium_andersonii.AAC.1
MPDSQRGFRPRPISAGRARQYTSSPNSYPSSQEGLPKKALEARKAVVAHQVLCQQLASTLNQPEHAGRSTGTSPWTRA